MSKRIALFGGSFNPPGVHHVRIARELSKHFDEVKIVPCGPRPDKSSVNSVDPIYRAAMVDIAFCGIPRVRVDLFDLENDEFTRTVDLESRYKAEGEIWHVVGADLIKGGKAGHSAVQKDWKDGKKLWKSSRFAVLSRPDVPFEKADLPPHHELILLEQPTSSTEIREKIFHNESVKSQVPHAIADYIERHGLYRGFSSDRISVLNLHDIRPLVIVDERNPQAVKLSKHVPKSNTKDPNLIVVIGGDGAMLRAIRSEWRRRIPFYGMNAGHLGFLLNPAPTTKWPAKGTPPSLVVQHLPLFRVELETEEGVRKEDIAFNDAWVERATGQTAWIEVRVNGIVRFSNLMADGALVATAAGSASYARAMGAHPLPYNTRAMLLVGSNVLKPPSWKSAVLPMDSSVTLTTLDTQKRPLHGFIDGVSQGRVKKLFISLSRIASVEIAFEKSHDPAEKLAQIQFPVV